MSKPFDVFDSLIDAHLERIREVAETIFDVRASVCESEIEKILLAALMFLPCSAWEDMAYSGPLDDDPSVRLSLRPQHRIGPYRVDFAILPELPAHFYDPSFSDFKIVIECDGHAFHEKTKQQAARDKARDRALMAAGWRVMRFTGSEIFRDAKGCADQVAQIVDAAISNYQSRLTKRVA